MTTGDKLNKILEDEFLQESFMMKLNEEMNYDDEPLDKKFKHIEEMYIENPELVDDMLITLCGWSMDTLCNLTLGR